MGLGSGWSTSHARSLGGQAVLVVHHQGVGAEKENNVGKNIGRGVVRKRTTKYGGHTMMIIDQQLSPAAAAPASISIKSDRFPEKAKLLLLLLHSLHILFPHLQFLHCTTQHRPRPRGITQVICVHVLSLIDYGLVQSRLQTSESFHPRLRY